MVVSDVSSSATENKTIRFGVNRFVFTVSISLVIFATMLISTTMFVSVAKATGPKQFGIAGFTMETIDSMKVVETPPGKGEDFRLEKTPYVFTQAGGHPWALTTIYKFAAEKIINGREEFEVPTGDPKDVATELPPGLLGNPNPAVFPRCSLTVVLSKTSRCPTDTQVGVARFRLTGGTQESLAPLVNVTPEAGQSAEFGLETSPGVTFLLTAHVVHTPHGVAGCASIAGCYGLTVVSNEIPTLQLVEAEVTFWGVPADPSHDAMRGLVCDRITSTNGLCYRGLSASTGTSMLEALSTGVPSGVQPAPFLTMPTDCSTGPEQAVGRADSWEAPGSVSGGQYAGYQEATTTLPGATGCNLLKFEPEIAVNPDTSGADEPVGLGVSLKVPLTESTTAPATPQLRNAVVTFPEGLSIGPGVVDGIQACNESGPEGINFSGPLSEERGLNGELQLAPGHCPDASIVGTARAFTPLLDEPVEGHVYLARPGCGGQGESECTEQDAADGKLYQLYLELGGIGPLANTGVNLKVRLKTEANPATGQLTTVAEDNPQLPFSRLEINLNGGPRAPLDNPAVCGPAVTTTDLTPWSAPGTTPAPEGLFMAGTPDATPSSYYNVAGCAEPTPFNPGFTAGTVIPQAGQFSGFTLNLSRQDREQFVKGVQVHTPPGLLGMLSSVPLCGEPQAEAGTCSESAKIGTTRVASGAGSHPFEIEGNVYLTGPYDGAPFGLSIVTHVVAGPFNLGLVVVRARIDVNREDSTLTITTDETGPRAIPQLLDGVPLRLQRVIVNINRPDFMFNPTNCSAQQITAIVSANQNATAELSNPFAVGGCKSLAFRPKFKVSTLGRTSRAKGASLDVKLSYPAGSVGNEANIARVKVDLPKQLPSRLTTLQKACPAAKFSANPALCPTGSIVGVAKASTPLLPVGLAGPVYFVSHGGEQFPSLIVVLQGDGVRVDLTGATFINKAGITSSTFKTVPDVPVGAFELYLPQGKYSALAANGNLCQLAGKLKMPTEFVAQNGAVIKQSTKIEVSGCRASKAKPKKKINRAEANKISNGGASK